MQRTIQMRTAQSEVREERDLSVDAVSTASLSLFCPIRPVGA